MHNKFAVFINIKTENFFFQKQHLRAISIINETRCSCL